MADLYTPPDILETNAAWNATCGPCAVAAVLRRPVAAVRDLFPDYRGWVNPTQMEGALLRSGVPWAPKKQIVWPKYGLAWVQFEGPWESPGVPPAAAYRYTHWIGAAEVDGECYAYDANAGGWLARGEWESGVLPAAMAHHNRVTGWRIRKAWEVSDAA